jgi:hypothetical protein
MERFEMTCTGRIRMFLTWGLYALAVTVAGEFIAARGFPAPVSWAVALGMGFAVLMWTREI